MNAMYKTKQIYNILQKFRINTINMAGSTKWVLYNLVLFLTAFTNCGQRQNCLKNKMEVICSYLPSKNITLQKQDTKCPSVWNLYFQSKKCLASKGCQNTCLLWSEILNKISQSLPSCLFTKTSKPYKSPNKVT